MVYFGVSLFSAHTYPYSYAQDTYNISYARQPEVQSKWREPKIITRRAENLTLDAVLCSFTCRMNRISSASVVWRKKIQRNLCCTRDNSWENRMRCVETTLNGVEEETETHPTYGWDWKIEAINIEDNRSKTRYVCVRCVCVCVQQFRYINVLR